MATEIQRERLRGDLDADDQALTDAEIDDAFARASDQYGDGSQASNSFAVFISVPLENCKWWARNRQTSTRNSVQKT